MNSSEFKKSVLQACDNAFKTAGFKVPRKNCIIYPINDDFFAWVGLNTAANDGVIKINPFVGVHCHPIAETKAKLLETKYQLGATASYAVHLSTLSSAATEFVFDYTNQPDCEREIQRMLNVVTEFGLHYAKQIASYPALIPLLEEKVTMLGGFPESYALALHFDGQSELCQTFLQNHAQTIEQYGEAISKPFEQFCNGLNKISPRKTTD